MRQAAKARSVSLSVPTSLSMIEMPKPTISFSLKACRTLFSGEAWSKSSQPTVHHSTWKVASVACAPLRLKESAATRIGLDVVPSSARSPKPVPADRLQRRPAIVAHLVEAAPVAQHFLLGVEIVGTKPRYVAAVVGVEVDSQSCRRRQHHLRRQHRDPTDRRSGQRRSRGGPTRRSPLGFGTTTTTATSTSSSLATTAKTPMISPQSIWAGPRPQKSPASIKTSASKASSPAEMPWAPVSKLASAKRARSATSTPPSARAAASARRACNRRSV